MSTDRIGFQAWFRARDFYILLTPSKVPERGRTRKLIRVEENMQRWPLTPV